MSDALYAMPEEAYDRLKQALDGAEAYARFGHSEAGCWEVDYSVKLARSALQWAYRQCAECASPAEFGELCAHHKGEADYRREQDRREAESGVPF